MEGWQTERTRHLHLSQWEKYTGEWRNDEHHGQGTLTDMDASVVDGLWEHGVLKYAEKVSPIQRQPTQSPSNLPLEKAEKECAEIGFTIGTEKYGDCVMKLLN